MIRSDALASGTSGVTLLSQCQVTCQLHINHSGALQGCVHLEIGCHAADARKQVLGKALHSPSRLNVRQPQRIFHTAGASQVHQPI